MEKWLLQYKQLAAQEAVTSAQNQQALASLCVITMNMILVVVLALLALLHVPVALEHW
jgi:hypothetical protein